ncbi:MAG: hypothetical protein OXU67_09915, partial [Chloroflexota bacterium]|nr:hypothetical protein [Chloroflexota bacterium]
AYENSCRCEGASATQRGRRALRCGGAAVAIWVKGNLVKRGAGDTSGVAGLYRNRGTAMRAPLLARDLVSALVL